MIFLALVLGCSGDANDTATSDDLVVENFSMSECLGRLSLDTAGFPEVLTATSDTAGVVHIAHDGYAGNCCGERTPNPSISKDTISLAYITTGDECDCMCTFDLAYDIMGVPAGTYAVQYGASSTTVTVE